MLLWRCVQRGAANAMRDWFSLRAQKTQACGLLVETLHSNDPTYAEVDIRLMLDDVVSQAPAKDAQILTTLRDDDLNYRQVAYRQRYTKAQVSHAIERTRERWRD